MIIYYIRYDGLINSYCNFQSKKFEKNTRNFFAVGFEISIDSLDLSLEKVIFVLISY